MPDERLTGSLSDALARVAELIDHLGRDVCADEETPMKVSPHGLAEIISHEAIVLTRYKDSVGVWTLGVGHTRNAGGINPATFDGKLTVPQAIQMFSVDVEKYAARVRAAVKVPITQYEFDALTSFDFNTGRVHNATLVTYLNQGNRAGAAAAFMRFSSPPEIIDRRAAEMNLFRDGTYTKNPVAAVYPADAAGRINWRKPSRVALLPLLGEVLGEAPATPVTPATGSSTIRLGSKGAIVAKWQALLGITPADGDFGPKTEAATIAWQKARRLVPDGLVGPKSWAALDAAATAKAA